MRPGVTQSTGARFLVWLYAVAIAPGFKPLMSPLIWCQTICLQKLLPPNAGSPIVTIMVASLLLRASPKGSIGENHTIGKNYESAADQSILLFCVYPGYAGGNQPVSDRS